MKWKNVGTTAAKAVAFLVVFALLFQVATFVLSSKWIVGNQERYVADAFYSLDEDSVDVLVLGDSQVLYGVSTVELYDYAGISACCLGGGLSSLMSNYYWLMEAEKTQSPSLVMLDVSVLFEVLNEHQDRKQVQGLKLSLNKLRYIRSLVSLDSTTDSFLSYVFPIMKYHTRWSSLSAIDFGNGLDSSVCYRGFNITNDCFNDLSYDTLIVDNDDPNADVREMYDYQLEYFGKIVAYCQENDIELLLIKTPKGKWTLSDADQVQDLADSYGLDYLDCNWSLAVDAIGIDVNTDFQDVNHLNTRGADKLSDYLADYVTEHYDLPDRREDADFDLQIDREMYDAERNDSYLCSSNDPVEWLTLLKQHSACDVFLAVSGDIAGLVSEEIAGLLAELGLATDLNALSSGECFAALLTNDGTSVEEAAAAGTAEIGGTLDEGSSYKLIVKNKGGTATASLTIGSGVSSLNGAGLNICVYSEEQGSVIKTVCIDLETGEMTRQTSSG